MASVTTAIDFTYPANFNYNSSFVTFISTGAQCAGSPGSYTTSNPVVFMLPAIAITASAIASFLETAQYAAPDAIGYILNINGVDYYFNGTIWTTSSGAYAQSNTAAVVNSNLAASTLATLLGTGATILVKVLLHSGTGASTPLLSGISLTYTFVAIKPANPVLTRVYVWLKDILDVDVSSTSNAQLGVVNNSGFKYGSFFIVPFSKQVAFDANGLAQIDLVETQTPGVYLNFAVTYQDGKNIKQVSFLPCMVPNSGAAALTSMTTVGDGSGSAPASGQGSGAYILSPGTSLPNQVPIFTGTDGKTTQAGLITYLNISATAAILASQLAAQTAFSFALFDVSGFLTARHLAAAFAVVTDSNGLPVVSTTSAAELAFVHGVTSSIQTQLNALLSSSLANGQIFIGSAGGQAVGQTPSGEVSMTNAGVFTLSNAAVIAKVLTGYFPSVRNANVIAATDSILSAIQKVDGQSILGRREMQVMSTPAAATATVAGIVAPTLTATASAAVDADAPYINHATSTVSGNASGVISAAFTLFERNWEPEMIAEIKTDPTNIVSNRVWCGFFSAAPDASATPAISLAAFRYDDGVDGTVFWRTCTDSGTGTPTVTITTVPFAAATKYRLRIIMSALNGNVLFFINDVLVATHTATLPAIATNMGWGLRMTTTSAAARNIKWSRFAFRMNG